MRTRATHSFGAYVWVSACEWVCTVPMMNQTRLLCSLCVSFCGRSGCKTQTIINKIQICKIGMRIHVFALTRFKLSLVSCRLKNWRIKWPFHPGNSSCIYWFDARFRFEIIRIVRINLIFHRNWSSGDHMPYSRRHSVCDGRCIFSWVTSRSLHCHCK